MCCSVSCHKKITDTITTPIPEVIVNPYKPAQKDTFPYSWFGTWAGNLEVYNSKGLAQTVPMKLIKAPTNEAGVFQWNIIYGMDAEKGLRPYLLRTIDAAKGHYVHDELNSIKMEAYYLGGKLFSTFAVEGNMLTSIEEKDGDTIKFEIIFGKEKPVSETGGQIVKGDTMPIVKTLPVIVNQRAILKKIK